MKNHFLADRRLNPQETLQKALKLHQTGHLGEAIRHYQQVLKTHPKSVPVLTYCGAALLDTKRIADGKKLLQSAITLDPKNADAHVYLANAYQMTGNLEAAEQSYARALKIKPDNPNAQNNLGVLLQRMGRNEDAAIRFRSAIEHQPSYAKAYNNLAQTLAELGQLDEAIEAGKTAIGLQSNYADGQNTLGSALSRSGRTSEAIDAFQSALSLQPNFPSASNNLAIAQIIARQPDEAIQTCDHLLAFEPTNVSALASKAVALSEAGQLDALHQLVDLENDIILHNVDPSPDFEDTEAFNRALVEHILNHPSLTYELDGHATRKGKHTGELLSEPKGPMATFERMIDDTVKIYRAGLEADSNHPIAMTAPDSWKLTVWSVVLEEAGHQVSHIHESGWLSGVYYPKIPHDIGLSESDPSGWIEFGQPQDLYNVREKPPVKLFKPQEGMMILFPSYLFHRTVPTGSQDLRVSIAFDVMRAG